MSSLWTPSGEHPVDRSGAGGRQSTPPSPGPGDAPSAGPSAAAAPPGLPADERELSPEEQAATEEYARQLEAATEQLLAAPVGLVVAQQVQQLYDLAVLYLSQPEPRLDGAGAAIDAMAAVVERLGPRLEQAEPALRQALTQIQMAFVEVSRTGGAGPDDPDPAGGT